MSGRLDIANVGIARSRNKVVLHAVFIIVHITQRNVIINGLILGGAILGSAVSGNTVLGGAVLGGSVLGGSITSNFAYRCRIVTPLLRITTDDAYHVRNSWTLIENSSPCTSSAVYTTFLVTHLVFDYYLYKVYHEEYR
jgi:hypothetical protein